jgi:mevalonate kinase
MEVRAPGVIKLFGEHAVVYGRNSMALAVSKYAKCSSEEASGGLGIALPDLGDKSIRLRDSDLRDINAYYKARKSMAEYVAGSAIGLDFLPFATIAARLFAECGVDVLNRNVKVSSEIPIKSGMSSSASCFTAFTCLLAKGAGLSSEKVIDIARDGERVAHVNEGAGSIDVSTAFYGGYVTYNSALGARKEKIGTPLNLVLVNTGPKLGTAVTVGRVASLYNSDREGTERMLDEIDDCTLSGHAALEKGDLGEAGRHMFRNHELLKRLGVSNDNLDKVVELSRTNGAFGAKLSGGGGGGMAVVLAGPESKGKLIRIFNENKFDAFEAEPSMAGAASYLDDGRGI